MKRTVFLCLFTVVTLLATGSAVADDGLMTYDQFLQIRGLDRSNLECINQVTETVIHPRTQVPEVNKQVCEIWVKSHQLFYTDGSPVYRTERMVQVPTTTEARELFMVKQDVRTETTEEPFKRYVVTGR